MHSFIKILFTGPRIYTSYLIFSFNQNNSFKNVNNKLFCIKYCYILYIAISTLACTVEIFKMPFKSYPYQKYEENDVSEEETDKSETEALLEEPSDCYYFVYITFFIMGFTSSLPGCFFTVANKYWMYKFREAKSETLLELNPLQVSYTAYAALASSIPLPICFIINLFINKKISCQKRVIGSLTIMLILSFITLVFVKIDTSSWRNGFLVLTLSTIVIFNAACGILFSTVGAIIYNFSSIYITSFTLGQGVGGVLAALSEVAALAIGASPTLNALIYSVVGCFTILTSLSTYLILPKNDYYMHFMFKINENRISEFENDLDGHSKISYKLICLKIWHYIFCVCVGSIIALSVQPGVTVLIKSYGTGIWSDRYFVPVITFLLPSLGDCFGRFSSIVIDWPKNKYVLMLLNVIRIVGIPVVLFCNVQPRGNLPVIFNSDAYYIVFQAIAGFANGYLLNIAIISMPRALEDHEKYSAGLVAGIFLCFAANFGSLLSTVIVKII